MKITIEEKSNLLSKELSDLKAMISAKNEEINKLLSERAENDEKHRENLR